MRLSALLMSPAALIVFRRLTMFFKEQRTIASVVMPFFAKQEGLSLEALEQRTQLRELQMSFVYSAAIMRRYKVCRRLTSPLPADPTVLH